MAFHLCKADKKRLKLQIRGELWNGVFVKLPAHRDKKVAEQMLRNVESLNRSKLLGQLPDPSVVARLSAAEVDRYAELGLIEFRFLDRRRALEELLPAFLEFCQSDCELGVRPQKEKVNRVRRVLQAIDCGITINDLTQESVNKALGKFGALSGSRIATPISQKTRREYIFAIKSFCEWLVDSHRIAVNPLRKMKAPSAKGDPVRNRRPLEPEHFKKLSDYLTQAPDRYPHQRFDWTPLDRLMVYWAGVMTGFRMEELRSLTRAHVNFQSDVPTVTVDGWIAKNGQKATIPVPREFADAIDRYSAHLLPNAKLLQMPNQVTMLLALYRDMDAAGVTRKFPDGAVVDFHTLRSTAIYWWVTQHKLHLLDVQCMARLRTLSLVQEYVDNWAPDFKRLVANAPRVVNVDLPFERAGRAAGRAVA